MGKSIAMFVHIWFDWPGSGRGLGWEATTERLDIVLTSPSH